MEMETSAMPQKAPMLLVEDALASQVLEIIGGVTFEALQTLEETEEREVWSMEEGDDSVFYSDEDQARQDVKATTSPDFGAKCRRPVNSAAADEPIPQREGDPGEESMSDTEKREDEVIQEVSLTEEERQTPETEPADAGAQSDKHSEKSAGGECLQKNLTTAEIQMQPEGKICTEKANLPVGGEEETPKPAPFDVTNEERFTRLNEERDVPEQMFAAELQVSGDSQLQADQGPEQNHSLRSPVGFHQKPRPGSSTLPLPKKPCDQKSFDHLTSSKYSTVSYRRIRRGNTRQKIEQFEFMMNL